VKSYSWKEVSGKPVNLTDANTAKATFTAPSLSKESTLRFKLTVDTGKDKTANAIVNLLVIKYNSKSRHQKDKEKVNKYKSSITANMKEGV